MVSSCASVFCATGIHHVMRQLQQILLLTNVRIFEQLYALLIQGLQKEKLEAIVALVVIRTLCVCSPSRRAPSSRRCCRRTRRSSWSCRRCGRPPATSRGVSDTWSPTSSSRWVYVSVACHAVVANWYLCRNVI